MKKRFEIEWERGKGLIPKSLVLQDLLYNLRRAGVKVTELPEEQPYSECSNPECGCHPQPKIEELPDPNKEKHIEGMAIINRFKLNELIRAYNAIPVSRRERYPMGGGR